MNSKASAITLALSLFAVRAVSGQDVTVPNTRTAGQSCVGFSYGGDVNMETARWATYPSITKVQPASPAEAAGLKAGDVIVSVDSVDTLQIDRFGYVIRKDPGKQTTFGIKRGADELKLNLVAGTLGQKKGEEPAPCEVWKEKSF